MTEHNFDTAFESVSNLVADFQRHEKAYLEPSYSEQDVRKDFIDKFWIALGWDVNHEHQKNPNEREVKVESNVKVEGRRKKADYAFLAQNFRDVRFFVEAKKPARNIDNADNYFQTIRYGWNAQTPLSILTDFEQFRVLDCRYKPDIQTALNRAIPKLTFHYTEYADAEKFREIYYLFSREAVTAGKLEAFAKTLPKPTGKAAQRKLFGGAYKSVDEDFLQELDELREELARSFKNRNPHLNGEDLTEATQRTLDRLVFMRFLEDKLIEPEAIVERLGERGAAWADFVAETERLNRIYNGIIFKPHFIDKADFIVDERTFANVRERLSHKNTPYDFNSLPVHILGSIYERFLGKVIVTTDKRARVEEKPEVRKAGGVYYTPEYIVRYIVGQTIGKLIEGKTPEEIAAMRFADIACGSGSFLLGVYDELLRYHTAYYNRNKTKRAEGLRAGCIENEDGSLRLSLNQRKDILLNNIYGVDLDAQAVEVAQLSLFLKLLEDETTASAKGFQLQFRETMLPSLDKNVVHGNSLIGWDISSGLFDSEEERKLFPMDFNKVNEKFAEVMQHGGFDAIVGNPPYVRPHNIPTKTKQVLWNTYKTFVAKSDLYSVFMEHGLSLLKQGGFIGFIVPQTWTSLESFTKIREYILRNASVRKLIQLPKKVFSDATVETCIFIFRREAKGTDKRANIIQVERLNSDRQSSFEREFTQAEIEDAYLYNFQLYGKDNSKTLIDKIKNKGQPLSQLIRFLYGFKTADDEKFIHSSPLYKESQPFIRSANVSRYSHTQPNEYVWYVPALMTKNRKTARPGDIDRFEARKIIVARMGKQVVATYDSEGLYVKDAMLLLSNNGQHSLLYLLGIINSQLINYFYREFFVTIDVLKNALLSLPIRTINFSDPADCARHDRMVNLVEQMLASKRALQQARTDRDRHFYESKCAALDRQIDQLVYELYELTPDEIAIVEESNKR